MITVRIRFSVWLVSCYAHVFVELYRLSRTVCMHARDLATGNLNPTGKQGVLHPHTATVVTTALIKHY